MHGLASSTVLLDNLVRWTKTTNVQITFLSFRNISLSVRNMQPTLAWPGLSGEGISCLT